MYAVLTCDSRRVETATQTLHGSRPAVELVRTLPVRARPRVDRTRRRPSGAAGPRGQRPGSPAVVLQAVRRRPTPTAAPPRSPPSTAPAVDVLAGTADVAASPVDLPHLSRLLHLSAGVVRTVFRERDSRGRDFRPNTTWLFRAAGSAGGRFPLELYVAVPDGTSRDCRPACTGTTRRKTPSCRSGRLPRGDAPALVVTGVPWRTGWRYRERRVPSRLLGCRHGARAAARGRGLRRSRSLLPHSVPRRRGGGARRCRPTCTNGRSRSWRSATVPRRSKRQVMP